MIQLFTCSTSQKDKAFKIINFILLFSWIKCYPGFVVVTSNIDVYLHVFPSGGCSLVLSWSLQQNPSRLRHQNPAVQSSVSWTHNCYVFTGFFNMAKWDMTDTALTSLTSFTLHVEQIKRERERDAYSGSAIMNANYVRHPQGGSKARIIKIQVLPVKNV